MPTVEARSQVSLDELLKGVARLGRPALERFISQVLTLRAQAYSPQFAQRGSSIVAEDQSGIGAPCPTRLRRAKQ